MTYTSIPSLGVALVARLKEGVELGLLEQVPGDPDLIAKLVCCISNHFERPQEVLCPRLWAFLERSNIDTIPVLRCFTPWELLNHVPWISEKRLDEIQQSLAVRGLDLRDENTGRLTRMQYMKVDFRDLPMVFVELLVGSELHIAKLAGCGILYGRDLTGRSGKELTKITGQEALREKWRVALNRLTALLEVYKVPFRR